jgi:uncharacterized protein
VSEAPHPRPAWAITVDGADLTAELSDRLSSLTLTDNRGFEADQLDIVIDDTDGRVDLPPRGARVRLSLGWDDSGLIDKGSYVVDEIEHAGAPDQITIRARSADLRGAMATPMERSFHDTTVGAIVRTVASENGLTPAIAAELEPQAIVHIDQTNESSANLLTRLAGLFDAVASVKDERLLFIPAGMGRTASGKPIPVAVIERGDGDQHRLTLAERDSATAVRAFWYDLKAGKKGEVTWGKEEEAVAQGKKKPVASPVAETVKPAARLKPLAVAYKNRGAAERACIQAWKKLRPKEGWDGVKAAYNDRVNKVTGWASYGRADEERKHQAAVKLAERDARKIDGSQKVKAEEGAFDHSADSIRTLRHVYVSEENAKRGARTEYLRLGRGTAVFSITLAKGRAELFPDVPVQVLGFKPAINAGEWIATRVTHQLTDAGYTTALEMEIRTTEIPG